jgi:hypothetical protein
MAVKDDFSEVQAHITGAAVTVDTRGATARAYLIDTGTSPSGWDPEESDDGSSWANVAAADLRHTDANGVDQEGAPTLGDDEEIIVRYVGTKRYLRAGGTNLATYVLTGCPHRGPEPQDDV